MLTTYEIELEELRNKVKLRDSMCGAMYYNILNDECCEIANRCLRLGGDKSEISSILGFETFYLK